MDKLKVLVADPISPRGVEDLQRDGAFEVIFQTGLKEDQLLEIIPDCAALVVRSETKVNKRVSRSGQGAKGRRTRGRRRGQRGRGSCHGAGRHRDEHARRQHDLHRGTRVLVARVRRADDPAGQRVGRRREMGAQEIPGRRTLRQDPRHPGHGPHRQRTRPARHRLRDARAGLRSVPRRQPGAGDAGRTHRETWTTSCPARISFPCTCR